MKHIQKFKHRVRERGNVLFLILIAVALFAALSYAVTSSSRTSSGTTDGESNLINSAQITQYPASVRTAVVRMLINGVAANQLEFNGPDTYDDLTDTDPGANDTKGFGVFHPNGGGATLVTAPPEVMENNQPGKWLFNSYYQVQDIGTTVPASNASNEILAFLPGVQLAACRRLNEELGIIAVPGGNDADSNGVPGAGITIGNIPTAAMSMMGGVVAPGGLGIAAAATTARTIGGPFAGQSYGCFDANDGTTGTGANEMVYFHVLLDR